MGKLTAREVAVLVAVHGRPGMGRAEVARAVGIGTGAAAEVVGSLVAARLLAEGDAVASGGRGRPTRRLVAHPAGPLVLAADIAHEHWRLQAIELGGAVVATIEAAHRADSGVVLGEVAAAVRQLRRRLGAERVRGLGVAVPGTVEGTRLLDAPSLNWQGLDLRRLWPRAALLVAGNDATLAALAEAVRGDASTARLAVHLRIEAGLGGAIVRDGQVLGGARGLAGEFGHLPFGDPSLRCPCGAYGCWGTAVDGTALARLLGERRPRDPVGYARRVLRRAERQPAAAAAVAAAAAALGRGAAGLVHALDPDVITLGGVAADLLDASPASLESAYRAGLMSSRRAEPPALVPARLGSAGPIVGAAELVWSRLWNLHR